MFSENHNFERYIVAQFEQLRITEGLYKYDMGTAISGKSGKRFKPGNTQIWKRILGDIGEKPQDLSMKNYCDLCDLFDKNPESFLWELRKGFNSR